MSPIVVVIGEELKEQSPKVRFVEHDDMIEQLPSTGPHPALGHSILPGTLKTRSHRLDLPSVPRQNSIRAFESLTVPGGDKKCHLPHMGPWRGAREFSGPTPTPCGGFGSRSAVPAMRMAV